jgi:hypothetical protein
LKYLQDWTEIANAFDIATGYFEIGSLLALDGKWRKLDKIRILMGNEVSARTSGKPAHGETDRPYAHPPQSHQALLTAKPVGQRH